MIHTPKLTSAELGSLWATYLEESMTVCVYKYFQKVTEDSDIRVIVEKSLGYSQERVEKIAVIFNQEQIPIPIGFTDEDVNIEAPSLYSDIMNIRYVKLKASFNMGAYSTGKSLAVRNDVRQFYTGCLMQASGIYDESVDIMLSKGVLIRAPVLVYPEKVEFVKPQDMLSAILGNKNPLSAIEIAHLGTNAETNLIGKMLITGFSQVAKSETLRDYFWKGKNIAEKLIDKFDALLSRDDIPTPSSWDGTLGTSREAPFSDKLMLFHIGVLNVSGMGDYGVSLAVSTRPDVISTYAGIVADVGKYAAEGAALMIKNGWLELPPHAVDRSELVKS